MNDQQNIDRVQEYVNDRLPMVVKLLTAMGRSKIPDASDTYLKRAAQQALTASTLVNSDRVIALTSYYLELMYRWEWANKANDTETRTRS